MTEQVDITLEQPEEKLNIGGAVASSLAPAPAPAASQASQTITVNGVTITIPMPPPDNSLVFAPNEMQSGAGIASTDPSMTGKFIPIHEERAGYLLPNIPGYPANLPSLQLTPSGRLAFWNFPASLEMEPSPDSIWNTKYTASTKTFTKPAALLPMTSWGTYLNTFQYIGIPGNSSSNVKPLAYNQARCSWLFPTTGGYYVNYIPYYTNGAQIQPATCATLAVAGYITANYLTDAFESDNPIAGRPDQFYYCTRPDQWIFQNIQYYIDQFLTVPYSVCGAVPYGYNWCGVDALFQQAVTGGKLSQFLQNVDFLICPTGTKTFLDDVMSAVPIIICGAAAIITVGAGTPALIAAIAGSAIEAHMANESKQGTAEINSEINYNADTANLNSGTISAATAASIVAAEPPGTGTVPTVWQQAQTDLQQWWSGAAAGFQSGEQAAEAKLGLQQRIAAAQANGSYNTILIALAAAAVIMAGAIIYLKEQKPAA